MTFGAEMDEIEMGDFQMVGKSACPRPPASHTRSSKVGGRVGGGGGGEQRRRICSQRRNEASFFEVRAPRVDDGRCIQSGRKGRLQAHAHLHQLLKTPYDEHPDDQAVYYRLGDVGVCIS